MKKIVTGLAAMSMVIILGFGSISGLATVQAAETCSHGTVKDVFNPMYSWTESCTDNVSGCVITYTKMLRITYCTNCNKNLGESTFVHYVHSKNH